MDVITSYSIHYTKLYEKQPSRMQASLLLDERLGLRERFSTTLALADSDDPFAKAARVESLAAIQRVDLRGHFPSYNFV